MPGASNRRESRTSPGSSPGQPRLRLLSLFDLDFRFDLDRNVEWELGHADRGSAMFAGVGSVKLQNQIRAAVDDRGLLRESRRGSDHAEHAQPCPHAIEISQLALQ